MRAVSPLFVTLCVACSTTPAPDGGAPIDVGPPPDTGPDTGPVPDAGAPDDPGLRLRFDPIALPGEPLAPTDFVFLPGTDELLVATRPGRLLHYRLDSASARATLLDEVTLDGIETDRECGLVSLALDPDFATNRMVFLGYCTARSTSGVFRAVWESGDLASMRGSRREIVTVSGVDAGWHNVGAMGFEPSGTLWVLFGDKGMAELARDAGSRNGKLLRIVPSRDPAAGGYVPASDNPLRGDGARPEVFAMGLRSPWRGTRDHLGRYWIGDVGNHVAEEVNLVARAGADLGWPQVEGPCTASCEGLADPAAWFGHRDHPYIAADPDAEPTAYRAVWVSCEYRGTPIDRYDGRLTHRVLFGDFGTGFVRVLYVDELGRVREHGHVGHLASAAAWREGDDGWLYALGYGSADALPLGTGLLFRAVVDD